MNDHVIMNFEEKFGRTKSEKAFIFVTYTALSLILNAVRCPDDD